MKTKTKPRINIDDPEGKIFPPITLEISRKIWLRGDDAHVGKLIDSCLLRERDGKMCCVGIAAHACGFTKDELRGKGTLDDLFTGVCNTAADDTLTDAYSVNDDRKLTEKIRECEVRRLLMDLGFKDVVFTK